MIRDEDYRDEPLEESRTGWINESIDRDLSKLNRTWIKLMKCKPDTRRYMRLDRKADELIDRITEKGEQNVGYDPLWLLHFWDTVFVEQ